MLKANKEKARTLEKARNKIALVYGIVGFALFGVPVVIMVSAISSENRASGEHFRGIGYFFAIEKIIIWFALFAIVGIVTLILKSIINKRKK